MLCGVDEAGRGCCAGPLVVAAVVLSEAIEGLADSKVLSEKRREKLFDQIIEKSKHKILFFDNNFIDNFGLSHALHDALVQISEHFDAYEILMDGNCTFGVDGIKTMVKADAKVAEVSAASILAKVSRDRYMYAIACKYPQYSFAKHKGYITSLHVKQIEEFGYSSIHRKSYKIKALSEPKLF
ncbi:MAG: ribonuclease HII [Sulfurospirillum sp.]|nr:ribonuclease HII [Sulfurospirillum sp.]